MIPVTIFIDRVPDEEDEEEEEEEEEEEVVDERTKTKETEL